MLLCEVAAFYKAQNKTLWDAMLEIYAKYGYYKEGQVSIVLEGSQGAKMIQDMMTKTRVADIEKIGDYKVLNFRDYEYDIVKNMQTKETTHPGLPKSNVLYYELENNNWCCVRPSGTEPKIKLYCGVKGSSMEDSEEKLNKLKIEMEKIVRS